MVKGEMQMPKFNIGDKVVLKTVEEILALKEFKLDCHRGNIDYADSDQVLLWSSEIQHCGEEFRIVSVNPLNDSVVLEDKVGYRIANISPLALEPTCKLVDLQTAVRALKSGECDAIRFESNKSICAYLGDKGEFKKAIITNMKDGKVTLNYSDDSFFMHEEYLFDSKWELIVDASRKELLNLKDKFITSLEELYLYSKDFKHSDYATVRRIVGQLKK